MKLGKTAQEKLNNRIRIRKKASQVLQTKSSISATLFLLQSNLIFIIWQII
jgi:hypothetical protein